MGIIIKKKVFYQHLNKRTLWQNKQPTVPIDPADCGQVITYKKRPGRALVVVDEKKSAFLSPEVDRPSDVGYQS